MTKFIRRGGKLVNARVAAADKQRSGWIEEALKTEEGRNKLAQAMVGPIRKSLAWRMGF